MTPELIAEQCYAIYVEHGGDPAGSTWEVLDEEARKPWIAIGGEILQTVGATQAEMQASMRAKGLAAVRALADLSA